jgi:lysophospholipase L1-like esterase
MGSTFVVPIRCDRPWSPCWLALILAPCPMTDPSPPTSPATTSPSLPKERSFSPIERLSPAERRARRQRQLRLPWRTLSYLANFGLLVALIVNWTTRPPVPQKSVALAGSRVTAEDLLKADPLTEVVRDATVAGPRHTLNYDRWVSLLYQEAAALASSPPENLSILAGDSLSLWFPEKLLPKEQNWLNQGISGDTSEGLSKRLDAWSGLNPKRIFVLIGINDLLRGTTPATVLDNERQILRQLKQAHPQSQIVVQSVLPHRGGEAAWEGRDRLLKIPNEQIRSLNLALQAIAKEEGVYFLNLHPLFTDPNGFLRRELTTDGLHLNPQGYLVWSTAIEMFSNMELQGASTSALPPVN